MSDELFQVKTRVTAEDLMAALRLRYREQEYALFPQVADATGGHARRTADAIALSLWPSRGIVLHGFEFKVSRGDWLRELRTPEKAEAIARRCHYWWLVTPVGLVRDDECPPNWGLLELRAPGAALRVTEKASKLGDPAMDRFFVAGLLRAAQRHQPGHAELEAARLAGRAEGIRDQEAAGGSALRAAEHSLAQLQQRIALFTQASGVSLDESWEHGRIGAAVRVVLEADGARWSSAAARIGRMRQAATEFLQATAELEQEAEDPASPDASAPRGSKR